MSTVRLTCWGGVGSVTGANFLLESNTTRLLVDCGLLQGVSEADAENAAAFPYDPRTIDYLFITHAHMDHIGKIPKLVHDGFQGTIYSTPETKEIAKLMLDDAWRIMQSRAAESGDNTALLYGEADLTTSFTFWKTAAYHTSVTVGDFSVYLKDAGHILGSAMYECSHGERKILFTGDSGNSPTPLLRDTESIAGADYLVMDSVYSDRNHEPKAERDAKLARIVTETIERGGALVIPAFSLERTQVILYELNRLVESGAIPSVPVFLDSPLAEKVTAIYKRTSKYFNAAVQEEVRKGDDIFSFPRLSVTHSRFESEEIEKIKNPKIIIAGSGMSSGGRVVYHEKIFLPDPASTILLMGYQALGTLGREIEHKPASLLIDGENIPVRARIEEITGYSSHKDSDHLIEMAAQAESTLKKVFVVMGEPKASLFLVQRLRDYVGLDAIYPERGKVYELDM